MATVDLECWRLYSPLLCVCLLKNSVSRASQTADPAPELPLNEVPNAQYHHKLDLGSRKTLQSLRLVRLHLRHALLSAPLCSFRATFSVEKQVPPSERARVVANKLLVMRIVVVGASPEWQKMVQTPWELISRVSVNGLEQAKQDPEVHGQNVKILGESAPQNWRANRSQPENHDLDWRSIFCSKTERSRVLVMDLVNVFVQRSPMHCAMCPVVPCILEHEEDCDLVCHCPQRGERNRRRKTEPLSHWVKEPDLR